MLPPHHLAALGTFIEAELRARGWTNARLAEACEVSPSLVSRWRHGHSRPMPHNCQCIAENFGVDPTVVLRLAGHLPSEEMGEEDSWTTLQREWSRRFERRVRSLSRNECTERTISAWLDGFSLMVERLGV